MEAALDSPLEALAINYLTYGFFTAVNNIWAWIAVITAAVSFWRIRALPALTTSSQDAAPPRMPEDPESVSTSTESAPAMASCRVLEREGSTKMKFSLYYKEEVEVEEEKDLREDIGEGDENEEGGGGGAAVMDAWRGDWEGMMTMRMGDMGWYRWQDRMVLDGSVVRLWERKHAAARVVDAGGAW